MGEHAWTTKELEQAEETYGIKKVDLKAFILLLGRARGEAAERLHSARGGPRLLQVQREATKLYDNRNLEGLQPRLRLRCNLHRPSGPYPSLNTAESSCYCSDASTLAKGLRVQWEGLCGHSNSCSMPLALSFETCTDKPQFHNPLLG